MRGSSKATPARATSAVPAMSETFFESAQAILTGFDTALSRQWREEDRKWRREDMEWRKIEEGQVHLDTEFIDENRKWRGQDMEQRVLDNARFLWSRVVEKNRREVEERAEQLKAVSNLAALIAGFALIAFLEFSIEPEEEARGLVIGFGLTTALTVGLMINSMVTTSLMHASILKTGKNFVSEEDEAEFIFRCRQFAKEYRLGDRPPAPARSFEAHWTQRAEGEWRRAFFMFSAGIPTFLLNLVLAGWIKFQKAKETAALITVVMGLSCFMFFIAYRHWARHLVGHRGDLFQGAARAPIVPASLPFDWHLKPQSPVPRYRQVASVSRVFDSAETDQGGAASASTVSEAATAPLTGQPQHQAHRAPASTASTADSRQYNSTTRSVPESPYASDTLNSAPQERRATTKGKLLRSLSSAELILGDFRKKPRPQSRPSPPSQTWNRAPTRQLSLQRMAQAVMGTITGLEAGGRHPPYDDDVDV